MSRGIMIDERTLLMMLGLSPYSSYSSSSSSTNAPCCSRGHTMVATSDHSRYGYAAMHACDMCRASGRDRRWYCQWCSYDVFFESHPEQQRGPSSFFESRNSSVTVQHFHGTSTANARSILRNGFQPSSGGQLGAGVYLAHEDKAERFAQDRGGNGMSGVVFKCQFTCNNPKYVRSNAHAGDWAREGHDGVRTDDTSLSSNMEWCVQAHVTPVAWRYVGSSSWNSTSTLP